MKKGQPKASNNEEQNKVQPIHELACSPQKSPVTINSTDNPSEAKGFADLFNRHKEIVFKNEYLKESVKKDIRYNNAACEIADDGNPETGLKDILTKGHKEKLAEILKSQRLNFEIIDPQHKLNHENAQPKSDITPAVSAIAKPKDSTINESEIYSHDANDLVLNLHERDACKKELIKCFSPVYDAKEGSQAKVNRSASQKKLPAETFKPFFEAEEGNAFRDKMNKRMKKFVGKKEEPKHRMQNAVASNTYRKYL
eukprot:TRINITY_DN10691_c0_g6_i1.p1 TRINITY_DN10691_c0_g6~~TRINITY_DN10691_c0_g6_i1.p1  ORF type:complete len:255 (-),score=55.15 TRINITY_DN10691_c0_g6_i1:52-816(-)